MEEKLGGVIRTQLQMDGFAMLLMFVVSRI